MPEGARYVLNQKLGLRKSTSLNEISKSHGIRRFKEMNPLNQLKKLNIADSKKLSVHYDEDKKSYDFFRKSS